jgi:hypothetical protein
VDAREASGGMMVPRLVLSVLTGSAAMAGLVGSAAPVPARVPRPALSTAEVAAPWWIGAPVALAQEAVRQQLEQQRREAALTARLGRLDSGSVDLVVLSRGQSSYAAGIRTVEEVAALVRETVGG